MGNSVYTYSADEVIVVVGGVPLSGFADGTFVNVSRDEQAFTKVTGADGTVSRAKTANKSGTITITLLSTSPSNDILTGFAVADEETSDGVVAVLVKDLSGRTVHASSAAWIQQIPDDEKSKDVGEREWVLDCAKITSFLGGNQNQTGTGGDD